MKLSHSIISVAVVGACISFANLDAIPKKYTIRGFSRPCCGFVPSPYTKLLGIAGFADPENLGTHDFGRLIKEKQSPRTQDYREEKVGQVLTCHAGFVDVSHMRDNADWGATIYRNLREKIGTGASLRIGKEGGTTRATVELPWMSDEARAKITDEQLAQIAVALTFDIALFHEISTSFTMAVSVPRIPLITEKILTEKSSSFSVEDSYSNLLGATLGVAAAISDEPYNRAMTRLIDEKLAELGVQSRENAMEVFQSLKGSWWKGGLFKNYKQVRRRSYEFEGELVPKIPTTAKAKKICGEPSGQALPVPSVEAITGLSHREVAYIRVMPTHQYTRKLRKLGVELNADGSFTREQFPDVIPKIQAKFAKTIPEQDDYRE